jgi:hypothetical protein
MEWGIQSKKLSGRDSLWILPREDGVNDDLVLRDEEKEFCEGSIINPSLPAFRKSRKLSGLFFKAGWGRLLTGC